MYKDKKKGSLKVLICIYLYFSYTVLTMYVIKNSYPMFVQLNKENQFKEKYLLKVLRLSSRLNIV